MAFDIPKDILIKMQKKYPNENMGFVIPDLFHCLLQKLLVDRAVHIREFGKFTCYKTYSTRLGKETVRIKFTLSRSLINKIKTDKFLLESIPSKNKSEFSEKNEQLLEGKQEIRDNNINAQRESNQYSIQKTQENIALELVKDIIDKKGL